MKGMLVNYTYTIIIIKYQVSKPMTSKSNDA